MYLTRAECRTLAGQLILSGFVGTEATWELKEILKEIKPLGLVLFARNLGCAEANIELCRELAALRPQEPLVLSVDQEGGRVASLTDGMTRWPPMRALGQLYRQDPAYGRRMAWQVGQALAEEVRAIGISLNFAPVLDVHTNPANPIIGDRAFSEHPEDVAILGAAFITGMQGAGVMACGKHFPGHGDTLVDSHIGLPRVDHDLARLRDVEYRPFAAAISAGVKSIMTAHMVVEPIDDLPATLSARLLTGHLRQILKFTGAIIADNVEMAALKDHFALESMGPMGLAAGIDVFLACEDPAAVMALYRGIVLAVEQGVVSHQALADAALRARTLRPAPRMGPNQTTGARLARLRSVVDAHRPLCDLLNQVS
jgi:beta-N-acetylhexosaminidase